MEKGQKVKYIPNIEWGIGIVDFVFGDRSVIIHFPDRKPTHPDKINKYVFYPKEFADNFEIIGE